jgi:cytochrome P450
VLEDWVEESGEVFKISLLGKKFIVSADPVINHEILKNRPDKFQRFFKINEIMSEMGIVGLFNAEGEQWQQHRKLTAEALNSKNVQGFFPTLQHITARLHDRWSHLAGSKKIIDVQKEMVRYTVDITTNIAFGYDMNTLEKEGDIIQDHLEKIFPMINSRITAPIATWRFIKSKKDKEFDTALAAIETFVHQFIKEAKVRLRDNVELKANPTNFLEALLVEQEKNGNFTDQEVFGNVFTILLAGEDTTSNSISWTLYYLAQHPAVFNKVRAEADQSFPDDICALSNETVTALKYTEVVCMEAMRLKPVTPNLYMQALEEVTIQDLEIKKGQTVMMQNKVPQTDEAHFTNPDAFLPERWIPKACPMHDKHSPQIMRAFGAGPRYCPGRNLAVQEMKMAISMICKNFDLTLAVRPEEVKEIFSFTMFPQNLMMQLTERT